VRGAEGFWLEPQERRAARGSSRRMRGPRCMGGIICRNSSGKAAV
jgi:hypothetical protein